MLIQQKSVIKAIFELRFKQTCRDAFVPLGILTVTSIFILETLIFRLPVFESLQNSHN